MMNYEKEKNEKIEFLKRMGKYDEYVAICKKEQEDRDARCMAYLIKVKDITKKQLK